jgi:hypothetical protein
VLAHPPVGERTLSQSYYRKLVQKKYYVVMIELIYTAIHYISFMLGEKKFSDSKQSTVDIHLSTKKQ